MITPPAKKERFSVMATLTPDATFTVNGVTLHQKIIPDGTRWTDAAKAKSAGFSAKALYKSQKKLNGNGKPTSVTIHNTGDLPGVNDDAEQYTRATWPNQNMGSARVHFYVDDLGAWQNLKAGTGLSAADPAGAAEVSWHAGDGSAAGGGNASSISIEIIMNDTAAHDQKAKENGARLAAWLLEKNGLTINDLVTHTYWVNRSAGRTVSNRDVQSTTQVSGKKWCPSYILGTPALAWSNWAAFKSLVKSYMTGSTVKPAPKPATPTVPAAGYETARNYNKTYKKAWTVTAGDGLHIRTGAGVEKKDLGTIPHGTKVQCYGYYNLASNGAVWLCVVWGNTTGYCSKAYLK